MHKPGLYIASLMLFFSVILGIIGAGIHALISFSPIISFCSKFFPTTYKFQSIWLIFSLIVFCVLSFVWILLLLFSSHQYKKLAKKQIRLPKILNRLLMKYHISAQNIVYLNTTKHIAMCFGFFSPKIYISKGLFNDVNVHEFMAVLLHEKYHMEKNHNLGNLVVRYVSSILFFIPLVKEIQKQYMLCIENLADEYVIRTQKSSQHLRGALVAFITSNNGFGIHSSFSMHILERRVERILTHSQERKKIITVKQIISTVLSVGIFFVVFSPALVFSATMHIAKEASPKCAGGENCGNICQQIEYFSTYTPASFSQKLFSSN